MSHYYIFVIRLLLALVFGVFLSRIFYPKAPLAFVIALVLVLVGLAYLTEYLRNRKKDSR